MSTLSVIEQTMSSVEIAELTGKRHDNVVRDIKSMLGELEIGHLKFEGTYKTKQGKPSKCYNLPKRECTILVSGYNIKMRAAIIDRWEELESSQSMQLPKDPKLALIVQSAQKMDEISQRQAALEKESDEIKRRNELLESRLESVELQHRNGVPEGYLPRKQAHHLYGRGLSYDIFYRAMKAVGVNMKPYIMTTDAGHEVATTALKAEEIEPAVTMFLDDAVQATQCMCESPILDGKRFRFVKAA